MEGRSVFISLREMHIILLLCLVVAAVLSDLRSGRIPNGIIAAGLCCGLLTQAAERGSAGLLLCLGGILLPVLIFGVFYFFRMIGAGDIKLLCMAGGFFGPSGCFACIAWSVLFGGVISAVLMLRRRSLGRRLLIFSEYISRYSREKRWEPYLSGAEQDARFCFSVPILLGVLCQIGGSI